MTNILEVLFTLNPWWTDGEFVVGIPRDDYLANMRRRTSTGEILAVTGVRRVGKTTLINQFIQLLLGEGADPRSILFVSCEEPVIAGQEDPPSVLATVQSAQDIP